MRNLFISLSTNGKLENFLTKNRFGKRISRRFVAGESLSEAKIHIEKILKDGFFLSVAYLGEHFRDTEISKKHRDEYLRLAEVLSNYNGKAEISLKLSQLGLDIDKELAYENLRVILEKTKELGLYVNVDMEEYKYLHDTVDIVIRANKEGFRVGTVIQSYLFEANDILSELSNYRMNIRLVKGAYKESPKVAYQKKKDIDENYRRLAVRMMELSDRIYPEFATHDHKIIEFILREFKDVDKEKYEFQMLYGVRPKLQRRIKAQNRLRLYLPYGDHWYPYFMRRLAEKPSNAFLVLFGSFG